MSHLEITGSIEQRTGITGDAVAWLSIYLIVLFGIPSRFVIGPLGSAGAISMLMGLASLGLWLLARVGTATPSVMRPQPLRIALALFLFSCGISYALAMSRPIMSDEVSPSDVALLSLLSWTGTLLVANDGIPSKSRFDTLVWRLAIAGGLMAVLGIVQFVTRQAIVDLLRIPGLTEVGDAVGTYYRDGRVRPSGTAIHPLEFGALLTILLPLALHVGFHYKTKYLLMRWWPAVAIAGVVAISSSRTAYLTAVIAVAVSMIGWTAKQRWVIVALGVVGVIGLIAAAPNLVNSVVTLFMGLGGSDPSITSRTDSFGLAWDFLLQHPFFGRAMGTFLPKYRIFDNQYLMLLVSFGLVGTVLFLALAAVAIYLLVRVWRSTTDPTERDLVTSLLAALVSGGASLAFFDAFAFPMTMGTVFLLLGMVGALSRLYHHGDREPGPVVVSKRYRQIVTAA